MLAKQWDISWLDGVSWKVVANITKSIYRFPQFEYRTPKTAQSIDSARPRGSWITRVLRPLH